MKDIKLEGLQRISIGTVFNYLPIKPGDDIDKSDIKMALTELSDYIENDDMFNN